MANRKRIIWVSGHEVKNYVNASIKSHANSITLQSVLKTAKSDSLNDTRKALSAARRAKVIKEEQSKEIIIVKRITMKQSSHLVNKPIPQIVALNKAQVLQAYLDNAFDETTAHESDKDIVNNFKLLSPSQIREEIKNLEAIAYKFY